MYISITVALPRNAEADCCTRDLGLQHDMQIEAIGLIVVVPNLFKIFYEFYVLNYVLSLAIVFLDKS